MVRRDLVGPRHLLRAVLLATGAAPGKVAALSILTASQGILPLVGLLCASRVIDAVSAHDLDGALVWLSGAALIAATAATAVSLGAVLADRLAEAVRDEVAMRIHRQSASLDLGYYEDPSFHDTLHRAQQEGVWRAPRLALGLAHLGRDAAALAAMVGLLATLRWWLAGILVLAALPGLGVRLRFSQRLFGLQRDTARTERSANYHGWLLTAPSWAAEVRILGLGPYLQEQWAGLRRGLRTRRLALGTRRSTAEAAAQVVAVAALFATFAFLAREAVADAVTLGSFVMYFGAIQTGLSSLQGLLASLATLWEDGLFLRHLDEFLSLRPRVVDPSAPQPFPVPIRQAIRLEEVTFRYRPDGPPALDAVSLEIPAGSVLALVGRNGSGKSTLVRLLLRLDDPDSGRILVDGTDLRQIAGAEIRRRASCLLQDFGRFAFTARDNVEIGDATDEDRGDCAARGATPGEQEAERLLRAARLSGALSEVDALPRRWDTVLGSFFDDGRELSAGQWQKLALARALYRDEHTAPLLLLDEPSAALDPLAEREFVDRLVEATRGRTTVLVSHRFSSVRSADLIAVLDSGRLVETGRHEELVRSGGLYERMYRAQASPEL